MRLFNDCRCWLALREHHFQFKEVSQFLNAVEMHACSAHTIKRPMFAYTPSLPIGQGQHLTHSIWGHRRSREEDRLLRPCVVRALIEDKLPCGDRQHPELQSSTLAREEG